MRRLTLILCLLVMAAVHRITRTTEAPATTQQKDVVLSPAQVALRAVNTGLQATSLVASIGIPGRAWITRRQPSAAIHAGAHSTTVIFSRSNRRGKLEFTAIGIDRTVENLTPALNRGPDRVEEISEPLRNST